MPITVVDFTKLNYLKPDMKTSCNFFNTNFCLQGVLFLNYLIQPISYNRNAGDDDHEGLFTYTDREQGENLRHDHVLITVNIFSIKIN